MEGSSGDIGKKLFEHFGKHFKGGAVICEKGEPAEHVFMIVNGRVRLIKQMRGVSRDIAILRSGDVLCENALMSGQRIGNTAVALGDCDLLALGRRDFEALLLEQSKVALKLIYQLIRRLLAAEEQIENMLLRDTESKIVNTLLRLADQQTGAVGVSRTLSVTPLELASRIGIDVDSVKRGIQNLRRKHYLRIVEERLDVVDIEALRKLHQLLSTKEELAR